MSDQQPPALREPIIPSLAVAMGAWWLGAMVALNSDNPSMFHRFMTSAGAGLGIVILAYLGRSRR